jgi:hypothetical protein
MSPPKSILQVNFFALAIPTVGLGWNCSTSFLSGLRSFSKILGSPFVMSQWTGRLAGMRELLFGFRMFRQTGVDPHYGGECYIYIYIYHYISLPLSLSVLCNSTFWMLYGMGFTTQSALYIDVSQRIPLSRGSSPSS